jgi:hypothetical protein
MDILMDPADTITDIATRASTTMCTTILTATSLDRQRRATAM